MPAIRETEVAIIGMGPTGATLANLLGIRGIRTVAIERDPQVHPKPRAVVFDHEAMRSFQNIGLADEILPHTAVFDRTVYRGAGGRLVKQLVTAPPPYLLGWCPNYIFSQPALDRILRDRAPRADVTVHLGAEATEVKDEGEAVRLEIQEAKGRAWTLRARFVVACDGGSSPMRRRLGIGFHDLDFDEPWMVVDAIVDDARLPELPMTNVQYCDPARPCTYVRGVQQ